MVSAPGFVSWTEDGGVHEARWHSESKVAAPTRIQVVDDRITADAAYALASQGTTLLWRGDFQNARQLLNALARRADRKVPKAGSSSAETFHLYRQAQAQRARTLGMLVLPFDADYSLPLRRAPDVRAACEEAMGPPRDRFLASMRELLGVIGAHEWRKNGVEVPALNARIHPHYGVFAPVRGEYVELVAKTPLPTRTLAWDIGTGTGVLALVLAQRGVASVIGTDSDPRAIACARENVLRLNLSGPVTIVCADLFPPGQAPLVVCNPPWIPARPSSPIEHAIFDPQSQMLNGFLAGLASHLQDAGEGWLILSDIAEHLGLRSRAELLHRIEQGGLRVLGRTEVIPRHPRVADASDPLYGARQKERTSLWRLARA